MADSTSVNLFKLLASALRLRPDRQVILSDSGQFPTDLYMAQGLVELGGGAELKIVSREKLEESLDSEVAVLYLSHVDFKTGELLDMAKLSAAAHAAGALTLWDLSHSVGALEVNLRADGADFAVGGGYKFLNGGPGAPSFLYVAENLQEKARSPLAGWFGHRDPFAFAADYKPGEGIDRFQCGTPPILSLAALDAALTVFSGVDLAVVRQKSLALGDLFLQLVEQRCAGLGLEVACPRQRARRGSQVCFRHTEGSAVVQALIHRGVVGDFRGPDVLRFGLTPLYMRFVDVWDAVEVLHEVLEHRIYEQSRFRHRGKVT
jgi:kynureninase